MTVVGTGSDEPPPSSELAGLVPGWLPRMRLLELSEPRLIPAAGLDPPEKAAAIRAGFESLLLCPLVLTNRPSGDPLIGVLAMLGEYRMLSGLLSGLGILASQVALALERVTLSDEVVRQRCEALFRTLVQDVRDVILVLDDDLTIRYASPSATRLYGRMPIKGTKALSLIAGIEQVANYPIFDPSTSEDVYRGLFRITRHDGQRRLVDVWVSDFRHDETVRGRVLTVRDVTEQHKLQDQLKFQALHDTSTGLPNRTLFIDRAKHALAMAQRTGATTVTSDVAVSYSRTMRRTDALVTVVA